MSDDRPIDLRPVPDGPAGLSRTELARVGRDVIIRQGDQLGIFTPITGAGDVVVGEQNLETVVAVLRDEVTRLQEQNAALKEKLAAAQEVHSPDDFAAALSHSLDVLQDRLAGATNATSSFAVRELQLEANVQLTVSDQGGLEYRLPRPGQAAPPETLSRLTLSVVPIARAPGEDGEPPRPPVPPGPPLAFTPDVGVEEVHGIGEAYRRRLNRAGVFTVRDLLAAGSRARTEAELEAMLAIDRRRLGEWLPQAELVLLEGVDGAAASVLVEAGVHDLAELGGIDPVTVAERFNAVAGRREGYRRRLGPEEAARLVSAAAAFAAHRRRLGLEPPEEPGPPA